MENRGEIRDLPAVIVIVADDAAVRDSLKFALEIDGFAIRTYADDSELLNDSKLNDCACLIIDQNMPGRMALDVLAKLRDRHMTTPTILITSHPTAEQRKRASRASAVIVEKPLFGNTLIESIRAAIATRPKTS